jgi:hypothetical protein
MHFFYESASFISDQVPFRKKKYDFMEQDRFLPDERDGTLKVFLKQNNIP